MITKIKTKRREKQTPGLKEIAAEPEAILASLGDHIMAVVVVDKNGGITRVNKGFETITGWQKKAILGKLLVKVLPREDENRNRVPFKKRILSKILTGKILTTPSRPVEKMPVFYYIRKNKSRFPAASVISPVVFNNKTVGAVEVFYDITREKELEQTRQDFLSLASHQLRTPLSGTKWLIETMQRKMLGPVTERQKEYLDQIYDLNERMIKLVFDMLHVLQFESGTIMVKKETVSITDLYKELITVMEPVAKSKGIILRNVLKNHKTVVVETNAMMLRSILECFVSNAITYSKSGQEVILDMKEESTAFTFFVKDLGIGIPKEEQKRIFERFYRGSNAKRIKPDGTGLGLYIASMLAEKIGAEVLLESEEGKGSTFYLRVPKKMVDKNL